MKMHNSSLMRSIRISLVSVTLADLTISALSFCLNSSAAFVLIASADSAMNCCTCLLKISARSNPAIASLHLSLAHSPTDRHFQGGKTALDRVQLGLFLDRLCCSLWRLGG